MSNTSKGHQKLKLLMYVEHFSPHKKYEVWST